MDKPRANPKKKRGPLYIAAAVVGVVVVTVGLSQLKPAAPSVDRAALWTDTVRQGPLVIQVRATGTLVSEQIRYIPAVTAGRVEAVLARPGTPVEAGTVLLQLSNPDVELQLLESERQLSQAQSELLTLRANLQTQALNQQSTVAQVRSQFNEAQRNATTAAELASKGLIPANEASRAQDQIDELRSRLQIEQQRLQLLADSRDAQLQSQQLTVDRLQGVVRFRRQQLESLNVTAGASGVLQELSLQVGQWVNPGTTLAIVVQPGALRAALRVPESQTRDIVVGLEANVDTRNGIVPGRVVRIDPSAQQGTVGIDVALEGELPPGARPDLSVDATIVISRMDDVLYVGRPNFGSANSTVGMFRIAPDGRSADRVRVQFGQSSVNSIQVLSGLRVGDAVILSEMSAWDNFERVRLQ
jgi:HlyD family secretion protein